MKSKKRIIDGLCAVLLLLTVVMTGCSRTTDEPSPMNTQQQCALSLATLRIADSQVDSRNGIATRAAAETTLPDDGKIGFFVASDDNYAEVNNLEGVYVATKQLWLPTDSIWMNSNKAKLAIYYPYAAAQSARQALNLLPSLRVDATKDLWYGQFEANNANEVLDLSLEQLYTRVVLTFVKDAAAPYTGTAQLTSLSLTGANIYPSATLSTADATYAYGTAATFKPDVPRTTVRGTDPTAANAARFDLMLIPNATLTQDVTVTTIIDFKEMTVTIPVAKFTNGLSAGKVYSVTIKLKPTSLAVGSIKTTEWDAQASVDLGDLTPLNETNE